MNIDQLKKHFERLPEGTVFPYGISKPFSWRGDYSEVAFCFEDSPMSREQILENIESALRGSFVGWKGGEYRYSELTTVNFESGPSGYSNNGYAFNWFLNKTFKP